MKRILGILLCLGINNVGAADLPERVHICTPAWQYYTQEDGKGLYHELWREVLADAGVELEITYAPYKRCQRGVEEKGRYDAFPGGYDATDTTLIPDWEIGVDWLTVAYGKETLDQWTDQSVMENKRVAWERGYAFEEFGIVTADVQVTKLNDLESGVKMLKFGRIDFLVDYEKALEDTVSSLGFRNDIIVNANVIKGPAYYMTFRNNEKGRGLVKLWDSRMKELSESGELQRMYARYEDQTF